jgi:hypothetical protein
VASWNYFSCVWLQSCKRDFFLNWPEQKILDVSFSYGQPGVEFTAHHSSYISVTHILFLTGQVWNFEPSCSWLLTVWDFQNNWGSAEWILDRGCKETKAWSALLYIVESYVFITLYMVLIKLLLLLCFSWVAFNKCLTSRLDNISKADAAFSYCSHSLYMLSSCVLWLWVLSVALALIT